MFAIDDRTGNVITTAALFADSIRAPFNRDALAAIESCED
jgi:hypothetical protein